MAGRSSLGKRPAEVTAVERKLAGMAKAIGLALYTKEDMQTPPAKKRRSDFGGTHEHPHADLSLACKHYCNKKKYLYVMTKTIKSGKVVYTSSFPTGFPDFLFFEKAADQKYTILAVEFKCGRDKICGSRSSSGSRTAPQVWLSVWRAVFKPLNPRPSVVGRRCSSGNRQIAAAQV
jgi:hypothetical protein